eukprot:6192343-Pleurochrysis_carterae.AAC.1
MSIEYPLQGAPTEVYSLFFASLTRTEKAKFLLTVPDALDRAVNGDIPVGPNLCRTALKLAVAANENYSAALHRLIEFCHIELENDVYFLPMLLELAAPHALRILSDKYLALRTIDQFVRVMDKIGDDKILLRLYHHSPDFVRRLHGGHELMIPTSRAFMTHVLMNEELSILLELRNYILTMSEANKIWLLCTAILVAPVSVWSFLQNLPVNIMDASRRFIYALSSSLASVTEEQMDFVLHLMHATMPLLVVQKALKRTLSEKLRSGQSLNEKNICMWFITLRRWGYFNEKSKDFRALSSEVCIAGYHAALSLLVHLFGLTTDDAIRYDLHMKCAMNDSFTCLHFLLHTLGVRELLLQDAWLFMRLLQCSTEDIRIYLLREYCVPYFIQESCMSAFRLTLADHTDFLQESQTIFRRDLLHPNAEMIHSALLRSLKSNSFSDDTS